MMSLLGFRPRQSGLAGRLTDDCPTHSSRRAEAGATATDDTGVGCRRETSDGLS